MYRSFNLESLNNLWARPAACVVLVFKLNGRLETGLETRLATELETNWKLYQYPTPLSRSFPALKNLPQPLLPDRPLFLGWPNLGYGDSGGRAGLSLAGRRPAWTEQWDGLPQVGDRSMPLGAPVHCHSRRRAWPVYGLQSLLWIAYFTKSCSSPRSGKAQASRSKKFKALDMIKTLPLI